jgi:AcrR family transcriptional regulator
VSVQSQAAADALLKLAADRPWREITLRDIAEEAGLDLVDLYGDVQSKTDLLAVISKDMDLAALRTAATPSEDPHDRLFDAVMARVEAMEPHRAALTLIGREAPGFVALHFPSTARAIWEAAGLEATPPRILVLTAVWARIAQVWRDDEGALNRTMAEIDKRLRQMRDVLGRVRAGF